MVISIARVRILLVSNPTPLYWPGVDRLILRTNQLCSSQYQAPLPIFQPETITKTTPVEFEHAL
jgi:hypothetical protein